MNLPTPFRLSLCALALAALAGCAAEPLRPVERLTPEQLAAIPLPGPAQAEQATRLTQQADREAQQAREAERRRELELQRWRAYDHFYGSIGYWHGYPRRWGWGAGYYFP